MFKEGLPIVGLEPSCLFALKDEIPSLLKTNDAKLVSENVMTFEELLSKDKKFLKLKPLKAKALLHGHCHQKAFNVLKSVENVLHLIEELEVEQNRNKLLWHGRRFWVLKRNHRFFNKNG